MKKVIVLLGSAVLFPILLGGCTSTNVRSSGNAKFGISKEDFYGGEPGVGVVEVSTQNAFGQEITTQVMLTYDGNGKFYMPEYASQGGDGIVKSMAPGTPGALALAYGLASLEPDRNSVDNSNTNEGSSASADGGDAIAEGGEGGTARSIAEGGDSNSAAYSAANAEAEAEANARNSTIRPSPRRLKSLKKAPAKDLPPATEADYPKKRRVPPPDERN